MPTETARRDDRSHDLLARAISKRKFLPGHMILNSRPAERSSKLSEWSISNFTALSCVPKTQFSEWFLLRLPSTNWSVRHELECDIRATNPSTQESSKYFFSEQIERTFSFLGWKLTSFKTFILSGKFGKKGLYSTSRPQEWENHSNVLWNNYAIGCIWRQFEQKWGTENRRYSSIEIRT